MAWLNYSPLVTLIFCTILGCNQNSGTVVSADTTKNKIPVTISADTNNKAQQSELLYLLSYAGKYPRDVNLLTDTTTILVKRLHKMIGPDFGFMKKTWATETPVEVTKNIFVANGCEVHNCSNTNFIIVADTKENIIYAGQRIEGKIKIFTEQNTDLPKQIIEWRDKPNE